MLPETVKIIVTAGHHAPSADNSQPWHFTWDAGRLHLTYDHNRVAGLTFAPDAPATLLAMGGVIENIMQAGRLLQLPLSLDLATREYRGERCYLRASMPVDTPINTPGEFMDSAVFKRHTNRLAFEAKALPGDLLATASSGREGDARMMVITDRPVIKRISTLVRRASEIRFQTRQVHEWLGRSLRFTRKEVARGDGLDVATLDLPPGGSQFLRVIADWRRMALLNRFGAYKLLSIIEAAAVTRAPALIAIISPPDEANTLAAGRLLTRVWIDLNANGIAVHPYYVVPDQLQRWRDADVPDHLAGQAAALAEETAGIFRLDGDDCLQMLLRIGYPQRRPVRSQRLPLEQVLTDYSE